MCFVFSNILLPDLLSHKLTCSFYVLSVVPNWCFFVYTVNLVWEFQLNMIRLTEILCFGLCSLALLDLVSGKCFLLLLCNFYEANNTYNTENQVGHLNNKVKLFHSKEQMLIKLNNWFTINFNAKYSCYWLNSFNFWKNIKSCAVSLDILAFRLFITYTYALVCKACCWNRMLIFYIILLNWGFIRYCNLLFLFLLL